MMPVLMAPTLLGDYAYSYTVIKNTLGFVLNSTVVLTASTTTFTS